MAGVGASFSSDAPQSFIPSEGAGGVLLCHPDLAPEKMWENAPVVGQVGVVQGLATDTTLRSVMSGQDAGDIAHVVSDTHHPPQASMAVAVAML